MNRRKKEVQEIVDEHLGIFGSPSLEDMDDAQERTFHRLSKAAATKRLATSESAGIRGGWRWRLVERFPLRSWRQFAMIPTAAAVILAVVFAITWKQDTLAVVEKVNGTLYRVVDGKRQPLHVGETVDSGTPVRTEDRSGAVLKLADGARVEIHEKSEISLEHAQDGTHIRLNTGSVNVTPSTQPERNLYVQNKEMTVPVVAALFQAAAPSAAQALAAQQPPTTLSSNPAEAREAFEVVSVKPVQTSVTPGARGGTTVMSGCALSYPQYDPRRFSVSGTTLYTLRHDLYTLIVWAYGTKGITVSGCRNYANWNLVSGGPGWIQSDLWDIQAVIPEGSLNYTLDQFRKGETPKLQKMLQTLLENRFKVVVRREMKEVPSYVLTAEKGAPRFTVRREIDTPDFRESWVGASPAVALERGAIFVKNSPIAELLPALQAETDRPVLDQTGLTGRCDFFVEYTTQGKINDRSQSGFSAPSIFKALEEQVGLKLESSKSEMVGWIVERAEKPSGN